MIATFMPLGKAVPLTLDRQDEASFKSTGFVDNQLKILSDQGREPTDKELCDLLVECCHVFACYFKADDTAFARYVDNLSDDDDSPTPVFLKTTMCQRFILLMPRVAQVRAFGLLSELTRDEHDSAATVAGVVTSILPGKIAKDIKNAYHQLSLANEQTRVMTEDGIRLIEFDCDAVIQMFRAAFVACNARMKLGNISSPDNPEHVATLMRHMESIYADMIGRLGRLKRTDYVDEQYNFRFSIGPWV